jgi:hypothetical protein
LGEVAPRRFLDWFHNQTLHSLLCHSFMLITV